jgi:hypothetical protein
MEAQSDVGISSDRITLLLGDMFDSTADCVVVPCSTNANMGAEIRSHLDQIGVTLTKERLEPGEVVPTTVGDARGSPRMVLFAAVVAGGKSTPDIVESAARHVGGLVAAGSVTAFPLLGAGSGRVAPEEAVEAMVVGFFSTAPRDAEMRIHVQSAARKIMRARTRSSEFLGIIRPPYVWGLARSGNDGTFPII